MFLLATPVQFVSGGVFYRETYEGLKHRCGVCNGGLRFWGLGFWA